LGLSSEFALLLAEIPQALHGGRDLRTRLAVVPSECGRAFEAAHVALDALLSFLADGRTGSPAGRVDPRRVGQTSRSAAMRRWITWRESSASETRVSRPQDTA